MLYYSEILNKKFVTEEELRAAEEKHAQEQKEKEEAKAIKAEEAKAVEKALKHLLEVKREANKAVAAAKDEYLKLRDEFVKKYGGWHYTYTDKDGERYEFFGSIKDIFTDFFEF